MKYPISDFLIADYTAARDRLAARTDELISAIRTGIRSGNRDDLLKAGGAFRMWQLETIEFAAMMERTEQRLKSPPRPLLQSAFLDIWPAWLLAVFTVSMALIAVFR